MRPFYFFLFLFLPFLLFRNESRSSLLRVVYTFASSLSEWGIFDERSCLALRGIDSPLWEGCKGFVRSNKLNCIPNKVVCRHKWILIRVIGGGLRFCRFWLRRVRLSDKSTRVSLACHIERHDKCYYLYIKIFIWSGNNVTRIFNLKKEEIIRSFYNISSDALGKSERSYYSRR